MRVALMDESGFVLNVIVLADDVELPETFEGFAVLSLEDVNAPVGPGWSLIGGEWFEPPPPPEPTPGPTTLLQAQVDELTDLVFSLLEIMEGM